MFVPMVRRPISISIIGWLLIVGGLYGLFFWTTIELNPIAVDLAARSPIPLAVQEVYGVIDSFVVAACGIGFLKGFWWSRLVYLVWALLRLVFGLFVSPAWMVFAIFIFYAVVLSILTRRSVNLWFENSGY
jgi:hypothetical protein